MHRRTARKTVTETERSNALSELEIIERSNERLLSTNGRLEEAISQMSESKTSALRKTIAPASRSLRRRKSTALLNIFPPPGREIREGIDVRRCSRFRRPRSSFKMSLVVRGGWKVKKERLRSERFIIRSNHFAVNEIVLGGKSSLTKIYYICGKYYLLWPWPIL